MAALALPALLATEAVDGTPPAVVPAVPFGILLAGILLLINLIDPSVDPRISHDLLRRRAVIEVVLDSLVMGSVVWLVALDPTSSLWVLLLLPVLEGALRFHLNGAILAVAGNAMLYLGRDLYVAATHDDLVVDTSTAIQRVGLLLVVGIAVGSLASRLAREAGRSAAVRAEAIKRSEVLSIVAQASAEMTSLDMAVVRDVVHGALDELGVVGAILAPGQTVPEGFDSYPIRVEGDVRGHLVADQATNEDVEGALELLANHMGICLAQAELFVEAQRLRRRLEHQAYHDSLTGLPNRAAFDEDLRRTAERRRPAGQGMAVLFIDLDGFKAVNDRLGHDAGDMLLESAARRLENCLRPGDSVARLGGDEFTVLLDGVQDVEGALIVAERVLEVLDQPFVLTGKTARVSGSVGVAFSASAGADPDQLVRSADQAMYEAKRSGRGRVVVARMSGLAKAK